MGDARRPDGRGAVIPGGKDRQSSIKVKRSLTKLTELGKALGSACLFMGEKLLHTKAHPSPQAVLTAEFTRYAPYIAALEIWRKQ